MPKPPEVPTQGNGPDGPGVIDRALVTPPLHDFPMLEASDVQDVLEAIGITEAQRETLCDFVKKVPPDTLQAFQEKIVDRLVSSRIEVDLPAGALRAQATKLIKATGTLLKAHLAEDSSPLRMIKDHMKRSGNDLVSLAATLVVTGSGNEVQREAMRQFIQRCAVTAANRQGVVFADMDDRQISTWASQHYPVIVSLRQGQSSLLQMIIQEMQIVESEGRPEVVFEQRDIGVMFESAKAEVLEKIKPWEDRLDRESVEVDLLVPPGYSGFRDVMENMCDDEKITIAMQQFHPERGKYWSLDPAEAASILNSFVIHGSKDLPEEIKEMLTLAALAPDRGLQTATQVYDERQRRAATFSYNDDVLDGIATLLASCPENLRDLKETHLVYLVEERLAKASLDNNGRKDITALLITGMIPPPTYEFFAYFLQIAEKLVPGQSIVSDSRVELFQALVDTHVLWSPPLEDQDEDEARVCSCVGDIWHGRVFSRIKTREGLWGRSSFGTGTFGSMVYQKDYLEGDGRKSELFLDHAKRYIERAEEYHQKIGRIFTVLAKWKNLHLAKVEDMRILVAEQLASFPDEFTFMGEDIGGASLQACYDLYHGSRVYGNDDVALFEQIGERKWSPDRDETKYQLFPGAFAELAARLKTAREKTKQTSRELHIGGDRSIEVTTMMSLLRRDSEYRRWEGLVREKATEMLDRMSPERRLDEQSQVYFSDMAKGFDRYRSYLKNLALSRIKDSSFGGYIEMSNASFELSLQNLAASLSPQDVEDAIELVAGIDNDILGDLLLSPREFYKHTQASSDGYVFPFTHGGRRYIREIQQNMTEEDANRITTAFGKLKLVAEGLREDKYFSQILQLDALISEIETQKQQYDGWLRSEDRDRFRWGRESPRNLKKFLEIVLLMKGVCFAREEFGFTLNISENHIAVKNGRGLRLPEAMMLYPNYLRDRLDLSRIVPADMTLERGKVLGQSGPTGSGKTTRLESLVSPLVLHPFAPLASEVIVLAGDGLMLDRIRVAGFDVMEKRGRSVFQLSAKQIADAQGFLVLVADEPGLGAPTEYRSPFVHAVCLRKANEGGMVVIATHQMVDLAVTMSILGMEERFSSEYIDPLTHEAHEGIGGSFGLEMLTMQGCSPEFVAICREILDAATARVPDGSVDLTRRDLPSVKETSSTAFVDRQTLENTHMMSVLKYFTNRAGCTDREAERMFDQFERSLNGDPSDLQNSIEHFESLSLSTHESFLRVLSAACTLVERQRGKSIPTVEILTEVKSSPQAHRGLFLSLSDLEEVAVFQEDDICANLTSLIDFFPAEAREKAERVIKQIETDIRALDFSADLDAFSQFMKKELERDENYHLDGIDAIEDQLTYEGRLTNLWEERISQAREKKDDDFRATFQLYDSFIREKPESFKNLSSIYEAKIIAEPLIRAKEKIWQQFIVQEGKKEAAASALLNAIESMTNLFDTHLGLPVFGAIYAYSTRQDNQEITFCKPERVDDASSIPFPMQFARGVNIPVFRDVGFDSYVAQNLFMINDEIPMTLSDLPAGEGDEFPQESIRVLEYTGVQGGGKTETVRLQAQMRLLAEATGRVPAKWARVGPRPSRVIGVFKPRTTRGTASTYMQQAGSIRDLINRLRPGSEVYIDEPGQGTVQEEVEAVVAALAYVVEKTGGWITFPNHEAGAEDNWRRLNTASRVHWYPVAYEYTDDPAGKYILQYGFRGGAETFKIAEEMGIDSETIKLAEFLYKVRQEFEQHKARIL